LGYRFNFSDGRSASICTDTGFITDNAKEIMPKSDIVFIESNHEIAMVNAGSYPYILKQRILGANGHLSNFACSEYIKELAKSGTTRFVLSHLSRENNLPELARQTAISALSELEMEENKDYRLYVSPPENDARSIVL
jgi:phosphoribosyl 1,2-cyclic phosphodiesterase